MTVERWRTHTPWGYGHWCMEWRCCGLVWQLLLSAHYPARARMSPTCPVCGATIDPTATSLTATGPTDSH